VHPLHLCCFSLPYILTFNLRFSFRIICADPYAKMRDMKQGMERPGRRATFTRYGVMRGMPAAAPLAIAVATYAIAYGVLASRAGVSVLEVMVQSAIVFAGSAQMAALEQWSYPLPIVSIV